MEELYKKYADRDVQFFTVYVREAHPEERTFRQYKKHQSYEHKVQYACELVELKQMHVPVIVDGPDEAVHRMLGNLPNVAYIVNKEGTVVYKSTWTDAEAIDEVLAELVTADDPSQPVQKTMDTSHVGRAI